MQTGSIDIYDSKGNLIYRGAYTLATNHLVRNVVSVWRLREDGKSAEQSYMRNASAMWFSNDNKTIVALDENGILTTWRVKDLRWSPLRF